MAVDPSYTVRLAWHAHDLDTGGHLPADQVPYDNTASGLTATNAKAAIDEVAAAAGGAGAPASVDYLVGTASGALSAEIVVGTTPGGELGGTWASPTVDATHSGSTHAATQAAAEATAASALSSHVADTTSAHSATGVDITDAGSYYTEHDRRSALQEIGAGGIGGGGAARRSPRRTRARPSRRPRRRSTSSGRGHGHEHGRRGDGDGNCGRFAYGRADCRARLCGPDPDDGRHHEPARAVVD
jgi:hypothetical protein